MNMISDSKRNRNDGGGGSRRHGRVVVVPSSVRGRQVNAPSFPSIPVGGRRTSRDPTPAQHRSQSLGPSKATPRNSRDRRSTDRRGISQAPGNNATPVSTTRSSSRGLTRPTKKIGCLGSSSNMTRHRSRDACREEARESTAKDRHMMKSFEEEMRMRRSNSKVSPLSKTRLSTTSRIRGNSPCGTKYLGHSNYHRIDDPHQKALELSTPRQQQEHDRGWHTGEMQHQSPPSDTRRITSTQCSNNISPSGLVFEGRGFSIAGVDTNSRSRSQSQCRSSKCEASSDSRKYHRRDTTADSVKSTKSSSKLIKKSVSSSTGKTTESIYTKETEALSDSTAFCRFNSITEKVLRISPSIQKEFDNAVDYIAYLSSRASPDRSPILNEPYATSGATSNGVYCGGVSGWPGHTYEAIKTNLCNDKGYCVRHPCVQLRKKKMMGGWNVLTTNCPECCVEEMRRLKRLHARISTPNSASSICPTKTGRCGNMDNLPRQAFDQESKYMNRMNPTSKLQKSLADNMSMSIRSGRSKSCSYRSDKNEKGRYLTLSSRYHRDRPHHVDSMRNKAVPMFEFDIALDACGNVTSPRSVVRSRRSSSSRKSFTSGN